LEFSDFWLSCNFSLVIRGSRMAGMPTDREVSGWADEIGAVAGVIGPRFSRRDLRGHAERYLRGLISRVERKNGWQLAE
jgi:hypothetical protein